MTDNGLEFLVSYYQAGNISSEKPRVEDLISTHIQAENQMFIRDSDGHSEIVFEVRLLCALFEDDLNIV